MNRLEMLAYMYLLDLPDASVGIVFLDISRTNIYHSPSSVIRAINNSNISNNDIIVIILTIMSRFYLGRPTLLLSFTEMDGWI